MSLEELHKPVVGVIWDCKICKLFKQGVVIVSGQYHSSFKGTLRTMQPKLLYDSNLWPEGVLVMLQYYERNAS